MCIATHPILGTVHLYKKRTFRSWRILSEFNLERTRILNTIGEGIQGKSVDWHTDSKNVIRILKAAVESRIYIGKHKKFKRNSLTVTSHFTVIEYQERKFFVRIHWVGVTIVMTGNFSQRPYFQTNWRLMGATHMR